VFDKVTIAYRGAKFEIGRGRDFYGIWAIGAPRPEPLDHWPETPAGWSAAWTRFASIEAPDTIVPVGRRTPPVGPSAVRAAENAAPFGQTTAQPGETPRPADESVVVAGAAAYGPIPGPRAQGSGPAYAQPSGTAYAQDSGTGYAQDSVAYGRPAARAHGRTGAIAAAALLGAGVALGVAGLFPAYLGGASLAQQASQLIPHVAYLAVWAASAVLILLGGARLRIGALLGVGLSVVTFGLFFADAATAVTGTGNSGGAGLVLSLLGWLACAAGSVLAFLIRPAARSRAAQDGPAWPRGAEIGPAVMLVLAGLGVAAAFAPAWDSFTLRTAAGQSQSLTAGNAFANPGLVIAGDLAVMLALAGVVIAAALWRPVRHGAVLLAGAVIPMAAQAVSALVQVAHGASPTQFGISSGQASQLGLKITSGLTPAFWIYCGFLVALVVSCAWMLFTPRQAPAPYPASGGGYGWNPAPDDDLADEEPDAAGPDGRGPQTGAPDDEPGDAVKPDFGTGPSHSPAAARDVGSSAA
jgi:hypothetical protein